MIRRDIKEINNTESGKYMVVIYCNGCGKTKTQEVEQGVNVYCSHCGNFIIDGMDWENIAESDRDDF